MRKQIMSTTIEQTINYLNELSKVFDFNTTLSMIHDKDESWLNLENIRISLNNVDDYETVPFIRVDYLRRNLVDHFTCVNENDQFMAINGWMDNILVDEDFGEEFYSNYHMFEEKIGLKNHGVFLVQDMNQTYTKVETITIDAGNVTYQ